VIIGLRTGVLMTFGPPVLLGLGILFSDATNFVVGGVAGLMMFVGLWSTYSLSPLFAVLLLIDLWSYARRGNDA
jgi:hypothetical protein